MKLLKQLQADINEARVEDESSFPEAERIARKLGLLPEIVGESTEESAQIAAYWRSHGGLTMSDAELRTVVANDLEMLEYPPEQVDLLVPKIIKLIKLIKK